MAANDPDRDFRRWLRHGEASALARVFDATANELFALALRLTGSRADAEDLVQTTFLVALEQAGSYDRRRRVVPWLVGILANHAHRLRRERGRDLDVGMLHTGSTPGPEEALERAELSETIDRALESVPKKYRPIVEARLMGGERSVDLARRLGRSPGVVRVWFQRGLEHFRRALPAEIRMGAALPLLSLERASEIRAVFVTAAESAKPAAVGGVILGLGGIVSSKKIVLTFGLVAILATISWQVGVGWTAVEVDAQYPDGQSVTLQGPDTERDEAAHELLEPGERIELGNEELAIPAAVLEVPPDSTWLRGQLVLRDRAMEEGNNRLGMIDPREVELKIRSIGDMHYSRTVRTRAHADGSFEVDISEILPPHGAQPPGKDRQYELSLEVKHPALMPDLIQVPVPEQGPVDEYGREWLEARVLLRQATTVIGQLEYPAGVAHRGIRLFLLPRGFDGPVNRASARDGSDGGAFSMRVSVAGQYYLLALAPGLCPLTLPIQVSAGEVLDVGNLALETGEAIRGELIWNGRHAARGSSVTARHLVPNGRPVNINRLHLLFVDGRFERAGIESAVKADGSFILGGLFPGAYELRTGTLAEVSLRDRRQFENPLIVEAPAEHVVLESGSALLRVEFRTDGRLLTTAEAEDIAASIAIEAEPDSSQTCLIDTDGTVLFQVRPGEAYRITANSRTSHRGQLASRRVVAPPAGVEAVERLDVRPERPRDTGTVVVQLEDGLGGGPKNAGFVFMVPDIGFGDRAALWRNLVGNSGRFQLTDVPAGRYTLRVFPGGRLNGRSSINLPIDLEISIEPGETVERVVTVVQGAGLRVSACNQAGDLLPAAATLRDSSGAPLTVKFILYHPYRGSSGSSTHLSDLGVTMVRPPLPPGEYQLEVAWPGYAPRTVPVSLRAGETRELEIDLIKGM